MKFSGSHQLISREERKMQKEIVEKFLDAKCHIFFELESGTKFMGRILKVGENVLYFKSRTKLSTIECKIIRLLALTDIVLDDIPEEF